LLGLLDPLGAKVLALRRRAGTLHANPGGDINLEEGDLVVAWAPRASSSRPPQC